MKKHDGCSCGFQLSRRSFLSTGMGGFLGFAAARRADALSWLLPQDTRVAKAKAVIVLWMNGAPSQFETWNPQEGRETGGPTKALETSVPGLRICEHLPRLAKRMEHISVIRTMTSKEASHERGRYLLHTGYVPQPTLVHPSFGSVTAMELGKKDFDLPNYISLGAPTVGAGFFPPDYDPFVVRNPGGPLENMTYPNGVDAKRFRARQELLRKQDEEFEKTHEGEAGERKRKAYEKAERLMHSPLLKTFDLKEEKEELKKSYGESAFGRGCLLARRLVEAGIPMVEVTLGGWDTHQDNFAKTADLGRQLDPAMSTLLRDLEERGMLESTLVVWLGEFGRTPKINANDGRDHYARAWSMAMAGGGVCGGRVVGETDLGGVEVKDRPVTVPDLFATLYTLLGVDPAKKVPTPLGNRFVLVDGGTPVKELLS